MNYHKNSYTGSVRKKIIFRVLTVIAALSVVSAATFAYGNYLKAKAERTQLSGTGAGRPPQSSGAGREPDKNPQTVTAVKSRCIPTASLDSAGAAEYVSTLADGGNTGVSAVLADREGYLTYPSDAVAKFTHQKAPAGYPSVLKAVISKAKERSLRTSALLFAGKDFADGGISAQIDALVAADASALGFDELVVFLPIGTDELGSELAERIVAYLNTLAVNASGCALGVCLSYDVFSTPRLSPHLELISASSDFLAVDLTEKSENAEAAAKYVTDAVQTLAGSFSLYSLRAVFEGTDADIADAQIRALADKGFANYMFTSAAPIKPPSDTDGTQNGDGSQGGQNTPPPAQNPDNSGAGGDVPSNDPEPPANPAPSDTTPPASPTVPPSDTDAPGDPGSPGTPDAPGNPDTPSDDPAPNTPADPDPGVNPPDNTPNADPPVTAPGADSPGTAPGADNAAPNGEN